MCINVSFDLIMWLLKRNKIIPLMERSNYVHLYISLYKSLGFCIDPYVNCVKNKRKIQLVLRGCRNLVMKNLVCYTSG